MKKTLARELNDMLREGGWHHTQRGLKTRLEDISRELENAQCDVKCLLDTIEKINEGKS